MSAGASDAPSCDGIALQGSGLGLIAWPGVRDCGRNRLVKNMLHFSFGRAESSSGATTRAHGTEKPRTRGVLHAGVRRVLWWQARQHLRAISLSPQGVRACLLLWLSALLPQRPLVVTSGVRDLRFRWPLSRPRQLPSRRRHLLSPEACPRQPAAPGALGHTCHPLPPNLHRGGLM